MPYNVLYCIGNQMNKEERMYYSLMHMHLMTTLTVALEIFLYSTDLSGRLLHYQNNNIKKNYYAEHAKECYIDTIAAVLLLVRPKHLLSTKCYFQFFIALLEIFNSYYQGKCMPYSSSYNY